MELSDLGYSLCLIGAMLWLIIITVLLLIAFMPILIKIVNKIKLEYYNDLHKKLSAEIRKSKERKVS